MIALLEKMPSCLTPADNPTLLRILLEIAEDLSPHIGSYMTKFNLHVPMYQVRG